MTSKVCFLWKACIWLLLFPFSYFPSSWSRLIDLINYRFLFNITNSTSIPSPIFYQRSKRFVCFFNLFDSSLIYGTISEKRRPDTKAKKPINNLSGSYCYGGEIVLRACCRQEWRSEKDPTHERLMGCRGNRVDVVGVTTQHVDKPRSILRPNSPLMPGHNIRTALFTKKNPFAHFPPQKNDSYGDFVTAEKRTCNISHAKRREI